MKIETDRLIITEFTMDMAEAVHAFLPVIMPRIDITQITGIYLADNKASVRVMERCGFVKEFEGIAPYQGEDRMICKFTYCL